MVRRSPSRKMLCRDRMSSFVLVPGAGGVGALWDRLVASLSSRGHRAIAVDLPADDERFGLRDYASRVIAVMPDDDAVLVAQSLAGFTAALVCEVKKPRALVFLNATIPVPGERVGAWSEHTNAPKHPDFDREKLFLHDVPREIWPPYREQSTRIFGDVCDFRAWPDVPIHVIAGRDDRFFPLDFQRRVARERLNVDVEDIAGGHLCAVSNPDELAEKLIAISERA